MNGRKWYISGAGDPKCTFCIFMGKSPNAVKAHHQQFTMIIIPMNSPGVTIRRGMEVFGFDDAPHGHMEIDFVNVVVPKENLLGGEG